MHLRPLSVAAALLVASPAAAQQRVYTAADYARAERVHEQNVRTLVDRNQPTYRWSDDGRTLYYQINDTAGPKAYEIDPVAGTRREVAKVDPPAPTADALPSPDGRRALLVRDANLWLRESDGTERQLTRDGTDGFAYGTMPDFFYLAVARLSGQLKLPPSFVSWSPDGTKLFGQRYDERKVRPYPYVAWTPADGDVRPRVYQPRQSLLGDAEQPIRSFFLTGVASGTTRQAEGLAGWEIDATSIVWSKAGDRAWLLATAPTGNGGALIAFDPARMTFKPLIEERRRGFFFFNPGSLYNAPNVRVLGDGREAIWFSPRDGWGNLYLYDLRTGRMKRQLTRGPGTVLDVVAVDEAKRRVFFTGGGRRPGSDPYLRQLYAVSLDGGPVRAITDDDLDHEIAAPIAPLFRPHLRSAPGVGALSPDSRWFVDTASRLDRPPVVTLRSLDTGKAVMELGRADPSRFLAAGGRPPERFRVKAADGTTDIWGAIYLPPDYDAARRYPVIDGIYAGPQVIVAPRTWNEGTGARPQMYERNSLAQLGFIVVTIDARGTPGRSAAFQDVSYGNFADPQLDDHVAALRQLAGRYPGMDLTRVGAYGHSLGGYTSARALLRHPQVYKVAVSSAGVYAWERFAPSYRAVFGEPDYGGGRTVRPDGKAIPANYAAVDNTVLADRLQGKLLIATGDLDENAPSGQAMAMVEALTRAGKPYDLMVLPNTTHRYGALNYFTLRLWNYFVENLMGAKPPADYRIGAAPVPTQSPGVAVDPPSAAPIPAAVEAVRRLAVPIGTADTPLSPAEAAAVRRTIAGARIIGFGEVGHGSREPLDYRNRLIRWLVENEGLTAVAIESGIANTRAIGDWVAGGPGDPAALLRDSLSWNFGDLQANLDLVRWLRDWNAAHPARTVRFHGLDASTRIALVDGKPELDGAAALDPLLAWLAKTPTASATTAELTALRPQLRSDRYRALDPAGRARFDAVLARADASLDSERAALVRGSSEAEYRWYKRLVWDLRQLPGLLAGWTTDPRETDKILLSIETRDATMAAHARWLLDREGPRGRMLVFAANGHISAGPMVGSVMRVFPRQPKVTGTWLRDQIGGGYRAILTASPRGKGADDTGIGSIDRAFVGAGQVRALLPLRDLARDPWWSATQTLAQGEGRIDELVPTQAADALLTIPTLTPAPTVTLR